MSFFFLNLAVLFSVGFSAIYIDLIRRFIPNREGQDLQATYSLLGEDGCPSTPSRSRKRAPHGELHFQKSMPIHSRIAKLRLKTNLARS
jgi:hypothetical protein